MNTTERIVENIYKWATEQYLTAKSEADDFGIQGLDGGQKAYYNGMSDVYYYAAMAQAYYNGMSDAYYCAAMALMDVVKLIGGNAEYTPDKVASGEPIDYDEWKYNHHITE